MEVAYLQTPIGTAEFKGNEEGLVSITVLDNKIPNSIIPDVLEDAVYQLKEYFEGKRKKFDLKLNPSGTKFQRRVWDSLLEIPLQLRFCVEVSRRREVLLGTSRKTWRIAFTVKCLLLDPD